VCKFDLDNGSSQGRVAEVQEVSMETAAAYAAIQTITRQVNEVTIIDVPRSTMRSLGQTDLREIVTNLLDSGCKKIVLNLSQVDSIGDFGIGERVLSSNKIRHDHGHVKLANVQPKLQAVPQVTHSFRVFNIQKDEEAAVQSFCGT
jgi:anti-sigma B factor antagonist